MLEKPKDKSHTKAAPDIEVVIGHKANNFSFETIWIHNLMDSANGV
jgi:hypothetical protein